MNIQGKLALLSRWINILSNKNNLAITQGEGKLYKKNEISGYYNDLTGKVNKNTLLDNNGIVVNKISNNRIVYFPISIFQYALGLWDLYLATNDEKKKQQFLNQCEWVIANQYNNGAWNCFSPIGYHDYSFSAMGQGEGISVLLRAYKITCEQRWLHAAEKALNFMLLPVQQGGTLLIEGDNYYLEEGSFRSENRVHIFKKHQNSQKKFKKL